MAKKTKLAIQQVAFENVFRHKQTQYCPLVIVDFQVHMWAILTMAVNLQQQMNLPAYEDLLTLKVFESWVKANWAIRLMRGPDMLPPRDYRIIVVDDLKSSEHIAISNDPEHPETNGYWRNSYYPKYKGNRDRRYADPVKRLITDIGHDVCNLLIGGYYSCSGFEADDWAGVVHRIKNSALPGSSCHERECFYSTVDGDWMFVTNDATSQYWAGTGPWAPRLKNEHEVKAYVFRKTGVALEQVSDLAKIKSRVGDMGDNLPIGTDEELFDLSKQHSVFAIETFDPMLVEVLRTDLYKPESNNDLSRMRTCQQLLVRQGLPIASLV